jgi:hypothetical protein
MLQRRYESLTNLSANVRSSQKLAQFFSPVRSADRPLPFCRLILHTSGELVFIATRKKLADIRPAVRRRHSHGPNRFAIGDGYLAGTAGYDVHIGDVLHMYVE